MTGCSHACRERLPENPPPRAARSVGANRTRTPGNRGAERSAGRHRPRRNARSDRRPRRNPPEARSRRQGAGWWWSWGPPWLGNLGARLRLLVWIFNSCHQTTDDLLVVELDITNLVSAEAAVRATVELLAQGEDAARE